MAAGTVTILHAQKSIWSQGKNNLSHKWYCYKTSATPVNHVNSLGALKPRLNKHEIV